MTKIYCADYNCCYNNDRGVCVAKNVALSWHSVATHWEGRQEFHRCKTRQDRDDTAEIMAMMEARKRDAED